MLWWIKTKKDTERGGGGEKSLNVKNFIDLPILAFIIIIGLQMWNKEMGWLNENLKSEEDL